jgi:hypothetical protein
MTPKRAFQNVHRSSENPFGPLCSPPTLQGNRFDPLSKQYCGVVHRFAPQLTPSIHNPASCSWHRSLSAISEVRGLQTSRELLECVSLQHLGLGNTRSQSFVHCSAVCGMVDAEKLCEMKHQNGVATLRPVLCSPQRHLSYDALVCAHLKCRPVLVATVAPILRAQGHREHFYLRPARGLRSRP